MAKCLYFFNKLFGIIWLNINFKGDVMQNIADFWQQFSKSVPDIVWALILLVAAFLVAWIAKILTVKLFRWLGIERLLAKASVEEKHITSAKNFVAKLVQLIVFVLFLPGVFDKLGLGSVSTPLVAMTNNFLTYLPNIVAAILVLVIGLFLAKVVKELLYPLFKKIKLEEWLAKIGVEATKVNISDILATTVYVVMVVFFAVEAINVLQLDILTKVGDAIIAYLPYALSAFLVLLVAVILGKWVESIMTKKFHSNKALALTTRVAILVVGTFMALDQLGIAKNTVNSAFIIILGGAAVAAALAFGLGGKEFAARQLKKLEGKIDQRRK